MHATEQTRFGLPSSAWMLVVCVASAVALSAPATSRPLLTAGFMSAVAMVAFGVFAPRVVTRLFFGSLGVLLTGYVLLDRGFAYLGFGPIHVGEVVLALGLLATICAAPIRKVFSSRGQILIIAFMAWGAIRTIPYLREYGVNAVRDGALWGYGLFALIITLLLRNRKSRAFLAIPTWYERLLPIALIWMPIGVALTRALWKTLPKVPGTNVAFIHVKMGDAAVHLAGAAAFLLLGLYRESPASARLKFFGKNWIRWSLWGFGLLLVANSRSALAAIFASLMVVALVYRGIRWKYILSISTAGILLMSLLNVQITLHGPRSISVTQIARGALSIFQTDSKWYFAGSKEWRLAWWDEILGYTVFGEDFWTGKGYGVSLGEDDGFRNEDDSLRSPHNGHLTVLARSGVPGLMLWLALNGWFASSLLRAHRRARTFGDAHRSRLLIWILAYWVAMMVNASFDVYLEGPQGGIWFWALVGVGIVAMQEDQVSAGSSFPAIPSASRM